MKKKTTRAHHPPPTLTENSPANSQPACFAHPLILWASPLFAHRLLLRASPLFLPIPDPVGLPYVWSISCSCGPPPCFAHLLLLWASPLFCQSTTSLGLPAQLLHLRPPTCSVVTSAPLSGSCELSCPVVPLIWSGLVWIWGRLVWRHGCWMAWICCIDSQRGFCV